MNSREIIKLIIAIIFVFQMTSSISTAEAKERLVLMPLQGTGIDSSYKPAMESAIAKGLFDRYEVLYGRKVEEKVKEIYKKLSEETVAGEECDDTKCMQQIGVEFQAELVATIKVLKNPQGYILVLNIINVLDNELVLSESEPCKGCDEFQVINVLKKMAGGKPASSEPKSKDKVKVKEPESRQKQISKAPADGMVFIKGGCFDMGDTFGDGGSDEKPIHEVCVDDFYLGEHEVTQGEWKEVMGNNPSEFKNCGDDCPVETVSWNDVQHYIRKLNNKTGLNYRLPTEAEWEYAARSGGREERYAGTSKKSELGDYAWYWGNSGKKTHPVKTKQPNFLGLYDMSGNVWEWVYDWYGKDYYRNSPKDNPKGPGSGEFRALRGGSWVSGPEDLRATGRLGDLPVKRFNFLGLGFRIAQD